MECKIDKKSKPKKVDFNKLLHAYLWTIISVSIAIFCILCVIGSLVLYLILTNQLNPEVGSEAFTIYVVIISFIIADIACLIVWFVMVHLCMLRAYKMKAELQTKQFNIWNLIFLILLFLSNVTVITLFVLWFGGFTGDIDTRLIIVYSIVGLEFFKGLIMVGILATSGKFLSRLRKI